MLSLESLFCSVDDFCRTFEPRWQQKLLTDGQPHRKRPRRLCLSEILTIVIVFHQSAYRHFKALYTELVLVHWRDAFPGLVSYQRFIEWMPSTVLPLCGYLKQCFASCTGISFIDSTSLQVCHIRRARSHKVFAGLAEWGKTSVGWFYVFKLHLVINERGELLNMALTPGNIDDCKPVIGLLKPLRGKVFGDRGYIGQALGRHLRERYGIELITKLRRNMKNRLMLMSDKLWLRRRGLIETVNDQLKNIAQIEHTRHRSPTNFLVNLLSGLISYCQQPKKPSVATDA
jgi:Transposase DDE domain